MILRGGKGESGGGGGREGRDVLKPSATGWDLVVISKKKEKVETRC